MTATEKNAEWANWTCATCQADMDDPVTIMETTCSNGHTNYLGPVLPPSSGLYDRGNHRRAFKTKADRARAAKEDRIMREHMQMISKAWERSRLKREGR